MESVLIEKQGNIAFVNLNEPKSLNALSVKLKTELLMILEEIEKDVTISIIIISGKGKSFCAGGDVKAMAEHKYNPSEIKQMMDESADIVLKIQQSKKIIISVIHGFVAGAGVSLAFASDMIIAEEDSKFILSFKNVGLIPDLGIHYHLTKQVGQWKAKEWIWKGATILAKEALQYGIVSEVTPKGEGLSKAKEISNSLAQGPIKAFIASKTIINQINASQFKEILIQENFSQSILRGTRDHKEGLQAFFEKRTALFHGN